MTRHDVNKVQALYIAALIQAARKLSATLQQNGGLKRTPFQAFEEELQDLLTKTSQLTEFERTPAAREGLRCRSDSPELLGALESAANYLALPDEARSALDIDDTEIAGMFDVPEDDEPISEPSPDTEASPKDEMDAFDL
jgi:hypothetical protein